MPSITFTVPALPIAQPRQRHRVIERNGVAFATNYTPAKDPVNAFKAAVGLLAGTHYTGPPLEGPIELRLEFVMPRPKRLMWVKNPMPRQCHTIKPDPDNLEKAVMDALKGLLWRDDAQVCQWSGAKWVAAGDEQPHVVVTVRTIEE